MKKIFLISACMGLALAGFAQDFDDDIYYNPKTAKTQTPKSAKGNPSGQPVVLDGETQTYYYYPESTYQENRDVDEYNRFGGYYTTPIDTIGDGIANSQDFVYTQEIQKYYNPTIVVDNKALLADVLDNSYGNVNIVYDYGYPVFSPWYSWTSPWYRTSVWGWYDPWYSWGYYPGWSWGWTWGWNGWYDPWFAWGPAWGPAWGWNGHWASSHPRPGNDLRPGWAGNTRPGTGSGHRNPGITAGQGTASRPGTRPGTSSTRPGINSSHRYNGSGANHRYEGTVTNRPNLNLDAQRPGQTGTYTRPGTSNGTHRPITTRPASNMTINTNNNHITNMGGNMQNATRPGSTTARPGGTTTRPNKNTTRPSREMTTPSRTTTRSSGYNNGGSFNRGGSFGGGSRGGGFGGGSRGGGGGGGHRR